MLTFSDAQADDGLLTVAGGCSNNSRFTYLLNSAVRRLMRRGDWVGTVTPIQICVQAGCLVLPRYVQSIRKLNTCHNKLQPGNLWYNFIDNRDWQGGRWGGYGGSGWWGRAWNPQGSISAQGQSCCYNSIPGDGWFVRAYARCNQDYGKTLTIFGVDNNNQPLTTNNGDGTWSDGVQIELGSSGHNPNYGSTSTFIRRIDRVVKPETQCQVMLYAYNPSLDTGVAPNLGMLDLAVYDPSETSPSYTRYQLNIPQPQLGTTGGACCSGVHSVVALVKLQFIPAKFPTDLVIIDNLDAIKAEIQSIRAQEAGDLELAKGYETDAVHELNRQLEDNFPDSTFSAVNNVFADHTFTNKAF